MITGSMSVYSLLLVLQGHKDLKETKVNGASEALPGQPVKVSHQVVVTSLINT